MRVEKNKDSKEDLDNKEVLNLFLHKIDIEKLSESTRYNLLMLAAQKNDLALLKKIKEKGVDIKMAHEDGTTAMSRALVTHHYEVAKYLYNSRVKFKNDIEKGTLLRLAIEESDVDFVEKLLGAGDVDVNTTHPSTKETAIQTAIKNHKTSIVCLLLEKGARITEQDKSDIVKLVGTSKGAFLLEALFKRGENIDSSLMESIFSNAMKSKNLDVFSQIGRAHV